MPDAHPRSRIGSVGDASSGGAPVSKPRADGKAVLVTGAAGFIGGHTAEAFAADGWRVFGLVHRHESARLNALAASGRAETLRGDVSDEAQARAVLDRCRESCGKPPDAIAHCAGRASDTGWRSSFRRANLDPVRFFGAAVNDGLAGRLVFVSTTDVYGLLDHRAADEDRTPLRAVPRNPYPAFKIEAENWMRAHMPPERWSIVRPAAVWGPDDPTLTRRVVSFLRWSPWIVHFGPWRGRNRWPLAHVRNVAQAIVLAASLDEARGQAVNVLDSERTTIDEFYQMVAGAFLPGRTYRTLRLPFWTGRIAGAAVTAVSNLLNTAHPVADPTLYALYSVSRDLDFSNERWLSWMRRAGRAPVAKDEGLAHWAGR